MAVSFKGRRFRKDIILQCVRWYVAYPLSYRQLEEMMLERGVSVDHTTLNRWVLKYSPELEKTFKSFKRQRCGLALRDHDLKAFNSDRNFLELGWKIF